MSNFSKISDTALFLREMVRRPRQIGAFFPSSQNLAATMARWFPPEPEAYYVELGPGTGAVTQALIRQGFPEKRLVAVEKSPRLADYLRKRFPSAQIITGDAVHLDDLITRYARQATNIATVFSSLPMINFEPTIAKKMAQKIQHILRPQGKLIQYSYNIGHRNLKHAEALADFSPVATKVVWMNFPPARIRVYEKRKQAAAA